MSRFQAYCLARSIDADRLRTDLASSPEIESGKVPLEILWNKKSASSAYAHAMEHATAEVLVFVHCDVHLPDGWFARLEWEIDRLTRLDPEWGVAGISSLTPSGELVGRVYNSSLEPGCRETHGIFGKALTVPVEIVSADELCLIVRRSAGVRFDPLLPEFHLYGTDIVLEAERQGKRAYGLDLPVVHNAKAQLRIGGDYVRAYKYMVRKWRSRLPVPTTCGPLTRIPLRLTLRRLRTIYKAVFRPTTYSTQRLLDPRAKALELGLDKLLAAPVADLHTR